MVFWDPGLVCVISLGGERGEVGYAFAGRRNWRDRGFRRLRKDEFEVEEVEYEAKDEMMGVLNKRKYFPLERLVKASRNPHRNTFVLDFH